MLILNLKENEKVLIGNEISVMVVEIRGKQIRLGIEAPDDVLILREKFFFCCHDHPQSLILFYL